MTVPQRPSVQARLDPTQFYRPASTDVPVAERCSQEPPRLYLPSRWMLPLLRPGLKRFNQANPTNPTMPPRVRLLCDDAWKNSVKTSEPPQIRCRRDCRMTALKIQPSDRTHRNWRIF